MKIRARHASRTGRTARAQRFYERAGFTLEGEPIEVPRTDGTASDQPLTRDDFAALAPD